MLGEALTVRHVASGRGSSYAVPLTPQQCADARDALAKGLFSGIFDWLVSKLNEGMANPAADAVEQDSLFVAKRSPQLFVGFLDVFGFENFEVNSFEQLCINYANEKLQKHFIDAVGKLQVQSSTRRCRPVQDPSYRATTISSLPRRLHLLHRPPPPSTSCPMLQLDDYAREGIETADIHFPDNGAQIECIDGKLGVMSLLDEELALPKASEEAYVEKLHARFGVKQHEAVYARPKRGGGKAEKPVAKGERDLHLLRFTLRHYAGDVTYTAEAWLDKDRLGLPQDLTALMVKSESDLIGSLWRREAAAGGGGGGSKEKRERTVFASFRASLRALSTTLETTSARYVRCVKPNAAKVPRQFDGRYIARQLQCTGVYAVVELQQCGYPVSLLKVQFVARYRSLLAYSQASRRHPLAPARHPPPP